MVEAGIMGDDPVSLVAVRFFFIICVEEAGGVAELLMFVV